MKIKSYLCLLMVAISCIIVSAQQKNTADKFLIYLNNYQKKELEAIITPDFKFKREFASKTTDRQEFLNNYLKDSKTLMAKFRVIYQYNEKNQGFYVVEDQSLYLKLLDVKFPQWKMTITTSGEKVSEVTLAPTEDYDNYITEMGSKGEKFNSWMNKNYPKVNLAKTALSQMLDYLYAYVDYQGVKLSDLQQYDDTVDDAVIISSSNSISDNMTCVHRNKLTETKRAAIYPFNKAKKVMLMSFNDKDWRLDYFSKTPKITDISIAKTSKELTKSDINKLTDLFYNYGYKKMEWVKTMVEEKDCPELKNAILFIDEKGKIFEYIALSFGCDEVEFSSQKVSYGDDCNTKKELLKQFFISNGIEIGE